jgi:hypothetical protein
MSRPACWIKATHLDTGRVQVFRSQTCAANELQVSQQCISASIFRGSESISCGIKFERMVPKVFTAHDMQGYFYSIGYMNWRRTPCEGYVLMADGVYIAQNTQIRYHGVTDLCTLYLQWQPRIRNERTWLNFVNHLFFMLVEGVYQLVQIDERKSAAAILYSFKEQERSVTLPLRVNVVLAD